MTSYFEFARTILLSGSLEDKLLQTPITWGPYESFSLPKSPGRNSPIHFSDQQLKFPKAPRLAETEKKAIALHSFANHELLAIEMMAAALLIYPHETEEDLRFKKGILTALKDEQKHLSLYIRRLNELGYAFGDFPLNDFFWRQMEKLQTPAQYLSVMALTFEAANLDFAQYYSRIFQSLGDEKTSQILQTVLEDELTHVSFGAHWMKKWREDKTLWQYYRDNLPWPLTPARSKGIGFDPSLRDHSVSDPNFLEELLSYQDEFRVTRRSERGIE